MTTWQRKRTAKAVNLARYSIPINTVVGVASGIEMRVTAVFKIAGVVVVDGKLRIG